LEVGKYKEDLNHTGGILPKLEVGVRRGEYSFGWRKRKGEKRIGSGWKGGS